MLKINKLCKKFNGKIVLDSISLNVKPGTIAVLLGPSGVGKSTLLRILNNLEIPDSGTIMLDGQALDLKIVNRSHIVGMVFQQFNLFENLTVEDNIILPLEKTTNISHEEAVKIARLLLEHYGLADKASSYPASLSGGQKQRLAIARAVALKPKIICFDEPTSALDPLLTNHVAASIQELAHKQFIVLVATHDTTLAQRLQSTIYLMKSGSIIASVDSKDFYTNRANYPEVDQFLAGFAQEVDGKNNLR